MKNGMKISNTSERINQLMETLGVTQSDIVKRTNLTKSSVSNYVSGKREPRQEAIYKISSAYNINPAWLMGYDVEMKENSVSPKQKDESEKLAEPKMLDIEISHSEEFRNYMHIAQYFYKFSKLSEGQKNLICEMIDNLNGEKTN